jgi:hypothetical protein
VAYVIPADMVETKWGLLPRSMIAVTECPKCGDPYVGYFKRGGELLNYHKHENGCCIWTGPHAATCTGERS